MGDFIAQQPLAAEPATRKLVGSGSVIVQMISGKETVFRTLSRWRHLHELVSLSSRRGALRRRAVYVLRSSVCGLRRLGLAQCRSAAAWADGVRVCRR